MKILHYHNINLCHCFFQEEMVIRGPVRFPNGLLVEAVRGTWLEKTWEASCGGIHTKLKVRKRGCVLIRGGGGVHIFVPRRTNVEVQWEVGADKDFHKFRPTLCCSICLSKDSKAARSPPLAPLGIGPRGRLGTRPGWRQKNGQNNRVFVLVKFLFMAALDIRIW